MNWNSWPGRAREVMKFADLGPFRSEFAPRQTDYQPGRGGPWTIAFGLYTFVGHSDSRRIPLHDDARPH